MGLTEEKPKLTKAVFYFDQEANCNSSHEYEEITVSYESSLGIDNDEGGFFVLSSETGWSIDNEKELAELFNRIKRVLNE